MECCITLGILTMMSIQMVMSYNVKIFPESTTTEVGTDSVEFTCRIQLTELEAMSPHWIIWWKDNTKIADNDTVLINSSKYSVRGLSSASNVDYIQILQVNGIEETDHGIHTCTLVFTNISISSGSTLTIRNFISQPVCSSTLTESETGQQQLTLICTSLPGDPPIVLHWIDNEVNKTSITQQNQNEPVTLSYTVSIESLSSNLRFTCRAKNTVSTDTKECVIVNLPSMTMTPTTSTTVSQKLSVSQTVDERAPTISITVSPKLSVSETIDGTSTAILTKTTNKAISHSPITLNVTSTSHATKPTSKEQNDITTSINVEAETSLPHTYSTSEKLSPSSNNNTVIITIFAILAGVILMTVFIAMLLLLRTHIEKKKNEETHFKMCARENSVHSSSEIEHPEGETDMHINENQDHRLITIEFGDDQLGCAMYKNSIYETNMDDPDPFYAAVGKGNVEETQENAVTDDPNKTKGIYPLEDNPEYMSIEDTALKKETALKKATAPPIKAEKPTKFKVKNYPAPNGDMYAQVDRSSISSSDRLSTIMNEEDRVKNYRAPNGDMYTQVDKSSNSKSDRLSTLNNEENKVKNYPAPNGDMYPQVDRSISDRLSTLLINEEQESVRRKKSEGKNDKLREKKENIGVLKKSSRFIDNDDTYTTISEIAQNGDGEEETDELTAAENEEDDKHEEDNVSRTSVGSSGSIHYEVDSNALYTRVLKSQKSTTD